MKRAARPPRKPIKRTMCTAVMLGVFLLAAFVWPTVMTGPLNKHGTNAMFIVWDGYADLMVYGLHGEVPRTTGQRTLRLQPAPRTGYRLPNFWFEHSRPEGTLRIQVPLFIPLSILLGWTTAGWVGFARRRDGPNCPACGYDLAGLTACPECGHGSP